MKPLTQIIATTILIPTLAMPCYAGRRNRVYQEPPSSSIQQYESRQLPKAPKRDNSPLYHSLESPKTNNSSLYKPANSPRKTNNNYSNKKMSSNEQALRNAGNLGGAVKGATSPSNIAIGVAGGIVGEIFSVFFGSSKSPKSSKSSK